MESKLPPKLDVLDLVSNPRVKGLREMLEKRNVDDLMYYAGYRSGYGGFRKEESGNHFNMGYEDGQADRWEDLK